MDKQQILRTAYYDPSTGFGSAQKLYAQVKQHKVTMREVKEFLSRQNVVQTTKREKGKAGSFIATHAKQEYQVDLIYLQNPYLQKGNKYGLTCIDVFTKQADIELIKKKDMHSVTEAMRLILKRMGNPESIMSDDGSEFNSSVFRGLMDERKIELIFTHTHAVFIERFHRTIKDMLFKYLQSTGSKTITNVLPKLLANYNNSHHTTIKMTPNEAAKESKADDVQANIISKSTVRVRAPIQAGDKVRVLLKRTTFDKGYQPRWSTHLYTVDRREGKYYIVAADHADPHNELRKDRQYLRAHIQLVKGDVEHNPNKADLADTLEGRLKAVGAMPVDKSSLERKERIEREAKEVMAAKIARLKARNRKKKVKGAFG